MSARTRASSPGGHPHFEFILRTEGWSPVLIQTLSPNDDSAENIYNCSPVVVRSRCRVERLGIWIGTEANSGQLMLGLHSSLNFRPETRICQTAAINVAGLTRNAVNFFTPTTTPIIEPGLYWIGFICDTSYWAGVAGVRFLYGNAHLLGSNAWLDGLCNGVEYQNVGAFNVPDPMVEGAPVGTTPNIIYCLSMRATPA